MFTGIVEEAGVVEAIDEQRKSLRLVVRCRTTGVGVKVGDSIAVNGCCLTAVEISSQGKNRFIHFDLLRETWRRTNLRFARPGSLVNLERPLRANGRLDGHFVTGHIDDIGTIVRWEKSGADRVLEVAAPAQLIRYVVQKGSIAVDGISLTVAAVKKDRFRVWIIPHTFEVTALRERKIGDALNLETDLLGKYVERFVGAKMLS